MNQNDPEYLAALEGISKAMADYINRPPPSRYPGAYDGPYAAFLKPKGCSTLSPAIKSVDGGMQDLSEGLRNGGGRSE